VAELQEFFEQVVWINRVTKVVKGGKNFSFSALVVVGDRAGRAGYAMGKAREVPLAIQKATNRARRRLHKVPRAGSTLPHDAVGRYGGGCVIMRPASPGTGVIAGGAVRAVMSALGVRDVLTKSIGSANPINVIRATFDGLGQLRSPEDMAAMRGKTVRQMGIRGYQRQPKEVSHAEGSVPEAQPQN
jgi:small subunit ribosomal protein S5